VAMKKWDVLCVCGHLNSKHERHYGKCQHMDGLTLCPCKKLESLYRTDELERRFAYEQVQDAERAYLHVCGWSATRSGERLLWVHIQRGVTTLTGQQAAMKLQREWDDLRD
jgi:hypothetical protein